MSTFGENLYITENKIPLTFDGWNWTLTNIKSYLTNHPTALLNVGANYHTTDDKTHIIFDQKEDKDNSDGVWFGLSNASGTVDWGDGNIESITSTDMYHTYDVAGIYHCVIDSSATYVKCGLTTKFATEVKEIYLSSSITSIGYQAFTFCSSLQSITIPDGVTSIDDYTFSECHSLQSVNIPDSVTSINYRAFSYCYALQSVNIPDGVTSIGYQAFRDCSSLQSITIPASVISIDAYAFYNCSSLHTVFLKPTTPPTLADSNAFSTSYQKKFVVPAGCLEAYQTATNWSTFASLMVEATTTVSENGVRFCDFEGTLLYSYTSEEALALTELPPAPDKSQNKACNGNINFNYKMSDTFVRENSFTDPTLQDDSFESVDSLINGTKTGYRFLKSRPWRKETEYSVKDKFTNFSTDLCQVFTPSRFLFGRVLYAYEDYGRTGRVTHSYTYDSTNNTLTGAGKSFTLTSSLIGIAFCGGGGAGSQTNDAGGGAGGGGAIISCVLDLEKSNTFSFDLATFGRNKSYGDRQDILGGGPNGWNFRNNHGNFSGGGGGDSYLTFNDCTLTAEGGGGGGATGWWTPGAGGGTSTGSFDNSTYKDKGIYNYIKMAGGAGSSSLGTAGASVTSYIHLGNPSYETTPSSYTRTTSFSPPSVPRVHQTATNNASFSNSNTDDIKGMYISSTAVGGYPYTNNPGGGASLGNGGFSWTGMWLNSDVDDLYAIYNVTCGIGGGGGGSTKLGARGNGGNGGAAGYWLFC